MKRLNLLYSLLLLCSLPVTSVLGQTDTCYVLKQDASGFDVASRWPALNTKACELVAAFDSTDYADSFKVFGFGFYAELEYYDGYSYPQAFLDMKAEVEQESSYYLLIGRQSDRTGVFTRFWVEVKLPEGGYFNCIDQEKHNGLITELEIILNKESNSPFSFWEKENNAMIRLLEFMQQLKICCNVENRAVSIIDSSLLTIHPYLSGDIDSENGSVSENFENTIAFINSDPIMPDIGFSLEYDGGICVDDIVAELKIYYARDCGNRNRRDTVEAVLDSLEFGYFYLFELSNEQNWGQPWPVTQGGRAIISVYDGAGEFIKSYKFTIKGENPKVGAVFDFLDETPYNSMWFLKKMFMHESGTHPQNDLGVPMLQFNEYYQSSENLQTDWDAYSRCPSKSFDCGWGLGQLTNPTPTSISLWNWKANVHNAYSVLEDKKSIVIGYINSRLQVIQNWENNNPDSAAVTGHGNFTHGGVTWTHSMSSLFSSQPNSWQNHFNQNLVAGQHSFLDAMLIKLYNGLGAETNNNHFYFLNSQGTGSLTPSSGSLGSSI